MSNILDTVAAIAREAGAIINDFARQRIGFELKGDFDLVTAADKASEKLIVERLIAAFPSYSIVAEEGGGQQASSEYTWYVDPLDGTTNFAHGFPGLQRVDRPPEGLGIGGRDRLRSDPRRDVLGGAGFRSVFER